MANIIKLFIALSMSLGAFASAGCDENVEKLLSDDNRFQVFKATREDGKVVNVATENYFDDLAALRAQRKKTFWENGSLPTRRLSKQIVGKMKTDTLRKIREKILNGFLKMANEGDYHIVATRVNNGKIKNLAREYAKAFMVLEKEQAKINASFAKAVATAEKNGNKKPPKPKLDKKKFQKHLDIVAEYHDWIKSYTNVVEEIDLLQDELTSLHVARDIIMANRKKDGFARETVNSPKIYFDLGANKSKLRTVMTFWNDGEINNRLIDINARITQIQGSLIPAIGNQGELRQRIIEQAMLYEQIKLVFKEARRFHADIAINSGNTYDSVMISNLENHLASVWDKIVYVDGYRSKYDISDWGIRVVQWRIMRSELIERLFNDFGLRLAKGATAKLPVIRDFDWAKAYNNFKQMSDSILSDTEKAHYKKKFQPIKTAYRGMFYAGATITGYGGIEAVSFVAKPIYAWAFGNRNTCRFITAKDIRNLEYTTRNSNFKTEGFRCDKLGSVELNDEGTNLEEFLKKRICNDEAFKQCAYNYLISKYELAYLVEKDLGLQGLLTEVTLNDEKRAEFATDISQMLLARYDFLASEYLKTEFVDQSVAGIVEEAIVEFANTEDYMIRCAAESDKRYVDCFLNNVIYGEFATEFRGTRLTEGAIVSQIDRINMNWWDHVKNNMGWQEYGLADSETEDAEIVEVTQEEYDALIAQQQKDTEAIENLSKDQRKKLKSLIQELEDIRLGFMAIGKISKSALMISKKKKPKNYEVIVNIKP